MQTSCVSCTMTIIPYLRLHFTIYVILFDTTYKSEIVIPVSIRLKYVPTGESLWNIEVPQFDKTLP